MTRAERIKAAEDALRAATGLPEAVCTGTEMQAFVRVRWGALDNPCQVEFPARDGSHARRLAALINEDPR